MSRKLLKKRVLVVAVVALVAFGCVEAKSPKISKKVAKKMAELQFEFGEYTKLQNAYFEELGEFGDFRSIGYKPIPSQNFDFWDMKEYEEPGYENPGIFAFSLFAVGNCHAANRWVLEPSKSESGGIVWKFTEPDEPACKGLVKFP